MSLSELQKDKLQIIFHDELLIKTIQMIFDERVAAEQPLIDETNDNQLLGEKYRAYQISKEIIEQAFIDLMSYKEEKKKIKGFDKSR